MKATVDGFKAWAVVAGDAEDQSLELSLQAAKGWFANAGVPELPEDDQNSYLYVLGVYMLATHYYDNRGVLADAKSSGAEVALPFGVNAIRLQLQQFKAGGGTPDESGGT